MFTEVMFNVKAEVTKAKLVHPPKSLENCLPRCKESNQTNKQVFLPDFNFFTREDHRGKNKHCIVTITFSSH